MKRKGKTLPNDVVKYKKAPQAPRRFKSAYMFFSIEKHKQIRNDMTARGSESKEKVCTTKVAKMVSQQWKDLPHYEREVFKEMAQKDKERYEREKSEYTGPWKVFDEKLRKKKDPDAPKKPMSAFLAFSNGKRAQVKKEHGGEIDNAELSRILAQMWKDAAEEKRKMYIEQEIELRRKYKLAMEQWRKENQERDERNDETCKLFEQNNDSIEVPDIPYGQHGHYNEDVSPRHPHQHSAPRNITKTWVYGGEYPYDAHQNGHLHQLQPHTYPSTSSHGGINQGKPPPQQQQQRMLTLTEEEGNAFSAPSPYYYAHANGGSRPVNINDTSQNDHYYYGQQQHTTFQTTQTSLHSMYLHQQLPLPPFAPPPKIAARLDMKQALSYKFNSAGENSHYFDTRNYSHHGGTDNHILCDSLSSGDSYPQFSPVSGYPHHQNQQQQQRQYQYNGNDANFHSNQNAITTPNFENVLEQGDQRTAIRQQNNSNTYCSSPLLLLQGSHTNIDSSHCQQQMEMATQHDLQEQNEYGRGLPHGAA